ncbi:MAG: methyltransferase domain-containing protein [Cytophagales bacterium]|nr:methyltransferase domain-containing protein [Rhizobacter sp.]
MPGPDIPFWQDRYLTQRTPWDDGADDPELVAWLTDGTLSAQDAPVLVPGCGTGRDLPLLASRGIAVTGIDYAPAAVSIAHGRLAHAGLGTQVARVEQADVLTWSPPSPVGAIIERTCLCALHPDHWVRYAQQLHAWLRPGGRLFAQFEQVPRTEAADGWVAGPPYHCDINAMRALFTSERWVWPTPPYPRGSEGDHLTVVLMVRRG